jgi:multimeric flavodoxin WrbA
LIDRTIATQIKRFLHELTYYYSNPIHFGHYKDEESNDSYTNRHITTQIQSILVTTKMKGGIWSLTYLTGRGPREEPWGGGAAARPAGDPEGTGRRRLEEMWRRGGHRLVERRRRGGRSTAGEQAAAAAGGGKGRTTTGGESWNLGWRRRRAAGVPCLVRPRGGEATGAKKPVIG